MGQTAIHGGSMSDTTPYSQLVIDLIDDVTPQRYGASTPGTSMQQPLPNIKVNSKVHMKIVNSLAFVRHGEYNALAELTSKVKFVKYKEAAQRAAHKQQLAAKYGIGAISPKVKGQDTITLVTSTLVDVVNEAEAVEETAEVTEAKPKTLTFDRIGSSKAAKRHKYRQGEKIEKKAKSVKKTDEPSKKSKKKGKAVEADATVTGTQATKKAFKAPKIKKFTGRGKAAKRQNFFVEPTYKWVSSVPERILVTPYTPDPRPAIILCKVTDFTVESQAERLAARQWKATRINGKRDRKIANAELFSKLNNILALVCRKVRKVKVAAIKAAMMAAGARIQDINTEYAAALGWEMSRPWQNKQDGVRSTDNKGQQVPSNTNGENVLDIEQNVFRSDVTSFDACKAAIALGAELVAQFHHEGKEPSNDMAVSHFYLRPENQEVNLNYHRGLKAEEHLLYPGAPVLMPDTRGYVEAHKKEMWTPKATPFFGEFTRVGAQLGDTSQLAIPSSRLYSKWFSCDENGVWCNRMEKHHPIAHDLCFMNFDIKAKSKQGVNGFGFGPVSRLHLVIDTLFQGMSTRPEVMRGDKNVPMDAVIVRDTIRKYLFSGELSDQEREYLLENGQTVEVLRPLNDILKDTYCVMKDGSHYATDASEFIIIGNVGDVVVSKVNGDIQWRAYLTNAAILYLPPDVAYKFVDPAFEVATDMMTNKSCLFPFIPNGPVTKSSATPFGLKRGKNAVKEWEVYKGEAVKEVVAASAIHQAVIQTVAVAPTIEPVVTPQPAIVVNSLAKSQDFDYKKFAEEIALIHSSLKNIARAGKRSNTYLSAADVIKIFKFGTDKLAAYKILYPGVDDAFLTVKMSGRPLDIACEAVRFYLLGHLGYDGDSYSPDIQSVKWAISDIKDIIDIIHAIAATVPCTTPGDKRKVKDFIRMEYLTTAESNIHAPVNHGTYLHFGDMSFFVDSDMIVYDNRKRAFNHTVCIDACPEMDDLQYGDEVSVTVAESFSNFMHFFYYGIIPIIANMAGNGFAPNFGANVTDLLHKVEDIGIYSLTVDEVLDQNGGAQHGFMNTFVPTIKTTLKPFNRSFANGKVVYSRPDLKAAPAKNLADRYKYEGDEGSEAGRIIHDKNLGETTVSELDLVQLAIPVARRKYELDFHFTKGALMSGVLGHISIALVKKVAPYTFNLLVENCLLKGLGDTVVTLIIALTVKTSKGLKRLTMLMGQGTDVIGGADAGWLLYDQKKPVKGGIQETMLAPTLTFNPGMSMQITENRIVAIVPKRFKMFKTVYHIPNGQEHPFDLTCSTAGEKGIGECVQTQEKGWNVLSPVNTVHLKGDRKEIICEVHIPDDKKCLFDQRGVIRHERAVEGQLIALRWKEVDSMTVGVKELKVEYDIQWNEDNRKGRGLNKSQTVQTNPRVLHNALNQGYLTDVNPDVIHTMDGLKLDVLWVILILFGNMLRLNYSDTMLSNPVYKQMYDMAQDIANKLDKPFNSNDPILWIEPYALTAGIYNKAIKFVADNFTHEGIWFTFEQGATMAQMLFELYTNIVKAKDGWFNVKDYMASFPELAAKALPNGAKYVVYCEDGGYSGKTNVLVFVVKDGRAIEMFQRCAVLASKHGVKMYNIELFERSTVKEGISNSRLAPQSNKALSVVIRDAELCRTIQRECVDKSTDILVQFKLLASFVNGVNFNTKYQIEANSFDGKLSIAPEYSAWLLQELEKVNVDLSDIQGKADGVFAKVCNALRDVSFRIPVSVTENDYGYETSYMTIWMPGLLEFSKLTSKSDNYNDFVSSFFYNTLLPWLSGQFSEFSSARQCFGMMSSLLGNEDFLKLINGRRNMTAKRIGTPGIFVGELQVRVTEETNSPWQEMKRGGIPVDKALLGEDVVVYDTRAPISMGALCLVRPVDQDPDTGEQYLRPLDSDKYYPEKLAMHGVALFYKMSTVQLGADALTINIDQGDNDGDPMYATFLSFLLNHEHVTNEALVKEICEQVFGMPMFSAKCNQAAAGNYRIKTWKKATLTFTDHTLAIQTATKSGSEYDSFNQGAHRSQKYCVGILYALYIICDLLCDIGHSLHINGCKMPVEIENMLAISETLNYLYLTAITGTTYEVTLGGYEEATIKLYDYYLSAIQLGTFETKYDANGSVDATATAHLAEILKDLGANPNVAGETLILMGLVSKCYYFTKFEVPKDSTYDAVLKQILYIPDGSDQSHLMWWLPLIVCTFELSRGNFDGWHGFIPTTKGKRGAGHRKCVQRAFETLALLKTYLPEVIHNSTYLYNLEVVYDLVGSEMISGKVTEGIWNTDCGVAVMKHIVKYNKLDDMESLPPSDGGSPVQPTPTPDNNDGGGSEAEVNSNLLSDNESMELKVVNGRVDGFSNEDTIYIGRGGKGLSQSPLANPYKIGTDGSRHEVFTKYEEWLDAEILKGEASNAYKELVRISVLLKKGQNIKLSCFCAPQKCHGDIIKKKILFGNLFLGVTNDILDNNNSSNEPMNDTSNQTSTSQCYAGVGSRKGMPAEVLDVMKRFAHAYSTFGYTLRSGAAEGSDTAFEQGATKGLREIYLPFNKFNGRVAGGDYIDTPTLPTYTDAVDHMSKFLGHDHWTHSKMTGNNNFGQKAHTRNLYQVFGRDLNSPAEFLICWTPGGLPVGGTKTAILLAEQNGIKVINLGNPETFKEVSAWLNGETPVETPAAEAPKAPQGTVYVCKFITREMVQQNPDKLFIFGDNFERVGLGGQAKAMRGEPNTLGIATKLKPSNTTDSFLTDEHFNRFKQEVDSAFSKIHHVVAKQQDVIFPEDGIGTGLANLKQSAPACWNYLVDELLEVGITSFEKAEISAVETIAKVETAVQPPQQVVIPQDAILFNSYNQEWAWLSNFYHSPIQGYSHTFNTLEGAYQWAKTCENDKAHLFTNVTGSVAKKNGRQLNIDKQEWENTKVEWMTNLLAVKFAIPTLKTLLLATDDRPLYHLATKPNSNKCFDTFWGVDNNLQGGNVLGILLMELRQQLHNADVVYDEEPILADVEDTSDVPDRYKPLLNNLQSIAKQRGTRNVDWDKIMTELQILTEEQLLVVEDAFLNGSNIILTGEGGGGKTHTTLTGRHILDAINYPYIHGGSTGISVQNVKGHGTFNSLFGLGKGFRPRTKEERTAKQMKRSYSEFMKLITNGRKSKKVQDVLKQLAKQANGSPLVIFVEEISMLESLLLSAASEIMEKEGIKILWWFNGDPCQSEPVEGEMLWKDTQVINDMGSLGKEVVSSILNIHTFATHNLTANMRAVNNPEWIKDLRDLRYGLRNDSMTGLPSSIMEIWKRSTRSGLPIPEDCIHLAYTNQTVTKWNQKETKKLIEAGASHKTYYAIVKHNTLDKKWDKKWNRDGSMTSILSPIEHEMTFCIGMPVMLRRNQRNADGEKNGSRGVVTELLKKSIKVEFKGRDEIVEIKMENLTEDLTNEAGVPYGDLIQIPCHPCFAMTIDKSQGLTLEGNVCLHPYSECKDGVLRPILGKNSFYVWASRCPDPKNMWIYPELPAHVSNPEVDRDPQNILNYIKNSYKTNDDAVRWVQSFTKGVTAKPVIKPTV